MTGGELGERVAQPGEVEGHVVRLAEARQVTDSLLVFVSCGREKVALRQQGNRARVHEKPILTPGARSASV